MCQKRFELELLDSRQPNCASGILISYVRIVIPGLRFESTGNDSAALLLLFLPLRRRRGAATLHLRVIGAGQRLLLNSPWQARAAASILFPSSRPSRVFTERQTHNGLSSDNVGFRDPLT